MPPSAVEGQSRRPPQGEGIVAPLSQSGTGLTLGLGVCGFVSLTLCVCGGEKEREGRQAGTQACTRTGTQTHDKPFQRSECSLCFSGHYCSGRVLAFRPWGPSDPGLPLWLSPCPSQGLLPSGRATPAQACQQRLPCSACLWCWEESAPCGLRQGCQSPLHRAPLHRAPPQAGRGPCKPLHVSALGMRRGRRAARGLAGCCRRTGRRGEVTPWRESLGAACRTCRARA